MWEFGVSELLTNVVGWCTGPCPWNNVIESWAAHLLSFLSAFVRFLEIERIGSISISIYVYISIAISS